MTRLEIDPDLARGQYLDAEYQRRRAALTCRDYDTITAQRRRDAARDVDRHAAIARRKVRGA